ncbi:MAG TPA: 4'-phosphopantetheinyl transferase superfamily protein [Pseudomonadales bacterium]|jgi:4'-phosphopantetheinyl transferase
MTTPNPFDALFAVPPAMAVLVCDITTVDVSTLHAQYGHWLSSDEQQRLSRFAHDEPAHAFLAARMVLRGVLAALHRCDPECIELDKNAWDKPRLRAPASDWQFNLSHSHGWLALAVSQVGEVGVDIEYAARSNAIERLAKRYFSSHEQAWLAEASAADYRQRFFDIWTLKEAYIKAVGKGLAVSLEGFGFTARDGRLQYRYEAGEPPSAAVQAWLSSALPERPVACVLLSDRMLAVPPVFQCVTLSGQRAGPLSLDAIL